MSATVTITVTITVTVTNFYAKTGWPAPSVVVH
jgi:hypothetical protein